MTRLAHGGASIDDSRVHGAGPSELQPWLGVIVETHAALDALMPRLREPGVLSEVARLGYRRRDLVDALVAMADDLSLPPGDFEVLWRWRQGQQGREAPTRVLVLATAFDLGLGPSDRARFRGAARSLPTSALRDWASVVFLGDDAPAAAQRLSERIGASEDYDDVALAALALASEGRAASLRVERRLMLRFPALARAFADDAPALRGPRRPAAAGVRPVRAREQAPVARTSPADPHAAIADIDRRLRPDRSEREWRAYSTELFIGATADEIEDAIAAAAATLTLAELRLVLDWPFAAQMAVLDALSGAPSVSSEALDFVEDFARSRSLRAHVCRAYVRARWREHGVLAAAIEVLVRHAPERWGAFLDERAGSLDLLQRMEAARLVRAGGGAGVLWLERLEVDPFRSVRDAAKQASRMLAADHARRQRTRWVLWAALVDTDDAYAAVRECLGLGPLFDERAWRRAQRALEGVALSSSARAWLELAAGSVAWDALSRDEPSRPLVRSTTPPRPAQEPAREGGPLAARLTASDGRSMRIDLVRGRTDSRRYALAEAIVASFVGCAPSRYMRLTMPDGSTHPVHAVLDDEGHILLEDADARILEHIPG